MPYRNLAIVGGGPKAAAIAAKASVLREITDGRIDIRVTVFERTALGAAWDGNYGFTDGEQQMCTPADRDIGFPYESALLGRVLEIRLQQRFSWQAYAVASGRYGSWIDGGRRRLSHRTFAAYVAHCLQTSGSDIVTGEVAGIRHRSSKWRVDYFVGTAKASTYPKSFDGIVITGTGPAKRRFFNGTHPRVLDGFSFWTNAQKVPSLIKTFPGPVGILGSGGTAAAVAAKLHRMQVGRPIVMIGSQPTLFARVDSKFENQLFRDRGLWSTLGPSERKAFTDRLTSGAVWSNVLEELTGADLTYRHGRVEHVGCEPPGNPAGELTIGYKTSTNLHPASREAVSLVVDATGFDAFWFADLLSKRLGSQVRRNGEAMRSGMDQALRLPVPAANLHVPGLSQAVSPAFTSLMALGNMSSHVLAPHVDALA